MEKEKYWVILHTADTTETGYLMNKTYIKTVWKGFPAQQCCEEEILMDFCFKRFGHNVAYVQGVSPCLNWIIRESNIEEYSQGKSIMWGGWPTKTVKLVLEIGDHGETEIIAETANQED